MRSRFRRIAVRVRRHRAVAAAMLVAVIAGIGWALADHRSPPSPRLIDLIAPTGRLHVDVADTSTARMEGLANQDALITDGLLLEWPFADRHPIWMRQMRFPLDLVWLDDSDRVLAVVADVPPCDQPKCPIYDPAGTDESLAVLELGSGDAVEHRITVGTRLERDQVRLSATAANASQTAR